MWMTLLIVSAVAIVLVLAVVAVRLQMKVREKQRLQQEQRALLQEQTEAQRLRVNKSIQVLAQGISEDQLTMTEGAIRIRVLLDSLGADESVQQEFSAFYQLAKATEHIPILEAWKKLSTKKKLALDSERERIERDYQEFISDAAKRIIGRHF